MKKKLTQLRWLVTMLLFVTAFAMPKMAWAEITPTKPSGDGTSAKPYQIRTAEELYWFAALVNGDTSVEGVAAADKAACAELTTNITVNSGVLKSDGSLADEANSFTAWTPINVDEGNPYTGTFDGKGYTISGLYFNDTSRDYIGLFGLVGSGSKIYNVGIVDSYFKGYNNIGGVCGCCFSSGEITNCYNTGTVIGTGVYSGGVCGRNYGTITDCYNTGNVYGASTSTYEGFVGGVCGINTGIPSNMGTITRSYNSGKVSGGYSVGGVCGWNGYGCKAQIINCYNTGEVIGTENVGGICGYNDMSIEKCYNTAAVSGDNFVGSVCGRKASASASVSVSVITCYYLSGIAAGGINNSDVPGSAESKTAEQFASGEVAYLLNESKSDGTQNWFQNLSEEDGDTYPMLKGTGTNTVYRGYWHGETSIAYCNRRCHEHAYDSSASNEQNGNHDKSYQGVFTWADNEDKTNATVTATFTCSVCGKEETPELTAVHDESNTNTVANCTEDGYNFYKTSYAFAGATFTHSYEQKLPALGHNMNEITFDKIEKIYSKQCLREGCGHIGHYATSDGNVEAQLEGGIYKVASFNVADATAYNSEADFTATSLAYRRTFYDDKWMAVYVPFAIDCSNLESDYEMATINNIHEYEQEDGTYKVVLEVKRVTQGGTIPALTPCLMRMKTTPEAEVEKTLNFENAEFSAAADKSIDCSSVTRYYQFTGSLNGKTGLNEDTDFVLNEGKIYKTSESTVLLPQRWYLSATDRTSSSVEPVTMLRSISINVIGDGKATGIEDIQVNTELGADAFGGIGIYDLQGRKLNSEPTKGMYIKNGKKYIK